MGGLSVGVTLKALIQGVKPTTKLRKNKMKIIKEKIIFEELESLLLGNSIDFIEIEQSLIKVRLNKSTIKEIIEKVKNGFFD